MSIGRGVVAGLVATFGLVPVAGAAPNDVDLLVRGVADFTTSADGRVIAFRTSRGIVARDLATGTTTTLATRTRGAGGAPSSGAIRAFALSGDGGRLAFETLAGNLSDEDDPRAIDIFVRDLDARSTALGSRASGAAGAPGDDHSSNPVLSADGGRVAFSSRAGNLVPGADDGLHHVYLRDLRTRVTTRVDVPVGPGLARSAFVEAISADGRRVLFRSSATNLITGPVTAVTNLYLRDLDTGTTTLVSRANGRDGAPADSGSGGGALSADGRRVAFTSQARNLSGDDRARVDVFVRDLGAGTTTLVSRANGRDGAGANRNSRGHSLSADGRYVAFDSLADNLSGADGPRSDVFVRDLVAGTTRLVSRNAGAGGAGHRGPARAPRMAADGRAVFFASVGPPRPGASPVRGLFRRELRGGQPPPSLRPTAPSSGERGRGVTLSVAQLRINQRISQAAIRRLNRLGALLDGRAAPAAPAQARGGGKVTLSAGQLRINQRISQAAVRRANAIEARMEGREPPAPPDRRGGGGAITLSAAQLLINQRISQAAVRRANALALGVSGAVAARG